MSVLSGVGAQWAPDGQPVGRPAISTSLQTQVSVGTGTTLCSVRGSRIQEAFARQGTITHSLSAAAAACGLYWSNHSVLQLPVFQVVRYAGNVGG